MVEDLLLLAVLVVLLVVLVQVTQLLHLHLQQAEQRVKEMLVVGVIDLQLLPHGLVVAVAVLEQQVQMLL